MNASLAFKSMLNTRILQYGVLGAISTAIHLSVAFLYLYFFDDNLLAANFTGFLTAFLFSYFSQSKYVFQSARTLFNAFKYFMVQSCSLVVAMLISDTLQFESNYVKTAVIVVVIPLATFVTHKLWTFKVNKADKP